MSIGVKFVHVILKLFLLGLIGLENQMEIYIIIIIMVVNSYPLAMCYVFSEKFSVNKRIFRIHL
jgi:hypothetical protein